MSNRKDKAMWFITCTENLNYARNTIGYLTADEALAAAEFLDRSFTCKGLHVPFFREEEN